MICAPAASPRRRPRTSGRSTLSSRSSTATSACRNRTYKGVNAILGDAGTVELVGLLGYYAMVAMTLDVFRMPVPEGMPLPFAEPAIR